MYIPIHLLLYPKSIAGFGVLIVYGVGVSWREIGDTCGKDRVTSLDLGVLRFLR